MFKNKKFTKTGGSFEFVMLLITKQSFRKMVLNSYKLLVEMNPSLNLFLNIISHIFLKLTIFSTGYFLMIKYCFCLKIKH